MAEFTVVYGRLAEAVIRDSTGRRLGERVVIAKDYPHWRSPSFDALNVNEHAYVIWKDSLIYIDTLQAWMDFQSHFERAQERNPTLNSYQLVAVTRQQHIKLFFRGPKRVRIRRRVNVSYWATPTHDMNPNDQLRIPNHKWLKKLYGRTKDTYNASNPDRSTRQRLKNEHIYGVMEWNGYVLIACVDTPLQWYLFKRFRTLQTSIKPIPRLYTYDDMPTRFIVVSEKQWRKIEATTQPVEWVLGRYT